MRSTQATATRRRPALDEYERRHQLQQVVVDEQSRCVSMIEVRPPQTHHPGPEVCWAARHARPALRRLAHA